MAVTASAIKELRDKTNAGMLDCRSALTEADGDVEKAEQILRSRGAAVAEKKAGRETRQGLVETYIHQGGQYGAMVEVNCETDFVARTDAFRELARELAMHITAAAPKYVDLTSFPAEEVEAKRVQLHAEAAAEGKPDAVLEKMVEGRMKKFAEEVCLLDQPWVRDPERTIRQLIQQTMQTTNENIQVRRFSRFQLGE